MSKKIEKEIFNNFLSESSDQLAELEAAVIELETDPSKRKSVDTIFRCVHSLKGSCAIFGLSGLKRFAHTMENLIERIRSRELEPTTDIINLILKGTDYLRAIFGKLDEKLSRKELTIEEEGFLDEITSVLAADESAKAVDSTLQVELMKFLDQEKVKDELETNDAIKEMVEIIMAHSPELVKERRANVSGKLFFGDMDVSREYFAVKSVIEEVNRQNFSDDHAKTVFCNLDSLIEKHKKHRLNEPLETLNRLKDDLELVYQDGTGFDEILAGITSEAFGKYETMLESAMQKKAKASADDSAVQPGVTRPMKIKVDQAKLDQAISTSGELVAVSEFFNYLQTQIVEGMISENLNNLKDAITSLQSHSEALSRELYDIRKVPVKEAMRTLPRLVRDMQVSFGKKVQLITQGEETPVDKGVVSKLETMFVHMVRNSIDHGIETPDVRKAAGKPEEGTLSLSVKTNKSKMLITLTDDGQGIDTVKVRRKLSESGLYRPEEIESFSDSGLIDKIFTPGFSMSEKVTETSGRGVGMDVVHSYLREMGGSVSVDNRPLKGISITLSIPLTHTTLVKKGLAVAVGNGVFLIPIEMVMESFRPGENEINTVEGKGEIVSRRGEIFSLIRLYELFEIETKVTDPQNAILVIVRYKNHSVCFMVDYVIGQRQIIYKQLVIKTLRQPPPFEGVSVYDGSKLAMILDVEGIIGQI